MSENGWNIMVKCDNSPDEENVDVCGSEADYDDQCGSEKNWYGWSPASVGKITAYLKGSGNLTLDFGNCNTNGKVKVYLDNDLKATAPENTDSIIESFNFTQGSLLEIEEEVGIIRLNSIAFECKGKI